MSLLDVYATDCVLMQKTVTDDPVGGYATTWTDGVSFRAAWDYQASPEMTVAEQQGVKRVYNIFVDKTLDLGYHDVFRRTDNGQTYWVTNPGQDRHTPEFSRLNRRVIAVEKYDLPHEGAMSDVQSGGGS